MPDRCEGCGYHFFKGNGKYFTMKKILLPFAITVFLFACNSTENKDSVETAKDANEAKADSTDKMVEAAKDDQDFLVKAASGGLMEVQLGKLTAEKSASASVKEFGQKMVTEHSKLNDELKALAAQKNITVPSMPGEDEMKHIDKMNEVKMGREFDKDYVALMVDDHKDDLDKFEKAATDCKDPDIKAFAAKYVPVLKQHLDAAQALRDKMKKS
jgi:putative membrane protein